MKRTHVFPALALASALVAVACSSDGPTAAPAPAPSFSVSNGGPSLMVCKTANDSSVSKQIDWKGGSLKLNGNVLVIPKFALSSPVTITMSQVKGINSEVDLQPQGLQFAVPASLTLDYSNCTIPPSLAFVGYLNPDGTISPLPSVDNRTGLQVTAPLAHFSGYAVAW